MWNKNYLFLQRHCKNTRLFLVVPAECGLQEAMQNDWVLTSGELERLLGVSIRTKGDYCDRGCWRFTKTGRIGREQGWRVSKI